MPKTKQQKTDIVELLSKGFKDSKAVVFANFQGLTVAEAEELRNLCHDENIKVFVAKKTLLKKAFEKAGYDVDPKIFEGGIATFFGADDEVAPAKIVDTFAKKHAVVKIFGGLLEDKFIDVDFVNNLAALPSKQELFAQLVGSINAPASGFVNVLAGNLRGLVQILSAHKEKQATA